MRGLAWDVATSQKCSTREMLITRVLQGGNEIVKVLEPMTCKGRPRRS